jgi:peptidyl-prolyl cis-trans isomerase SurA
MMNSFCLISLLALMPANPSANVQDGQVIEKIVAVVGGDIILLSEVEGVLNEMVRAVGPTFSGDLQVFREAKRKEIIDTLIAEKVLEQEIHKLHIDVTEQELERAIQDIVSKNSIDMTQLEMALRKQGLTLSEYKEGMKKQLLKAKIIQLKVRSKVQVTDQEVNSSYATRSARASTDVKIRAQHILFLSKPSEGEAPPIKDATDPAHQAARDALLRLEAGETFGALAAELSEGPSRARQGALGVFGRGEMMPEFEEAAFNAKVGQAIGPVRTPIGWHIILVNERISKTQKPIEDVEAEIRQKLYESEVEEAFGRYIEDLKGKVYIEIRDFDS